MHFFVRGAEKAGMKGVGVEKREEY